MIGENPRHPLETNEAFGVGALIPAGSSAGWGAGEEVLPPTSKTSARRGSVKAAKQSGLTRLHGAAVKTTLLVVLLVVSAYLMALAKGFGSSACIGWFSLIPLFLVIRLGRPAGAIFAGALWGVCLYAFSVGHAHASVAPSIRLLLLLPTIPAIYAYLGACLTRWIGFNPFVLGVFWMGVELALEPAGLRTGLLAGTQGDGALIQWVGGALGYVLVAFLVALVNASLASILSGVRLKIARLPYRIPRADSGASLSPQTFLCFPLFTLRPSRPRGPPI